MGHFLILAAVIGAAWLVNKKGEDTEDSLFKLGNRLRTLEDDIQELKQSVRSLESKLDAGQAKKSSAEPTTAKKSSGKKPTAKKKAAKKS